jgi:hypothetical protein
MGRTTLAKTLVWKAVALGAGLGLGVLSNPVHAAPAGGAIDKGFQGRPQPKTEVDT